MKAYVYNFFVELWTECSGMTLDSFWIPLVCYHATQFSTLIA